MFLINPYAFAVAGGDFEPIATVTVGSGGAASITFSSIPTSTYQHLQVRYLCRSVRANVRDDFFVRVGNASIDTGNNYAYHNLQGGNGGTVGAGAASTTSRMYQYYISGGNLAANIFGVGVIDILDYASTTKTKVVRSFTGVDGNGDTNLSVAINSGLWNSTSAIDQVRLYAANANLAQYSTAALYGVKAP